MKYTSVWIHKSKDILQGLIETRNKIKKIGQKKMIENILVVILIIYFQNYCLFNISYLSSSFYCRENICHIFHLHILFSHAHSTM